MTNIERLKMAIKGIDFTDDELLIYLQENELSPTDSYTATSSTNKKNILKTALSVLEDVANQPQLMKTFKLEDMTISQFSENLQSRIEGLEKQIRKISDDDNINSSNNNGSNFIYMFNN